MNYSHSNISKYRNYSLIKSDNCFILSYFLISGYISEKQTNSVGIQYFLRAATMILIDKMVNPFYVDS